MLTQNLWKWLINEARRVRSVSIDWSLVNNNNESTDLIKADEDSRVRYLTQAAIMCYLSQCFPTLTFQQYNILGMFTIAECQNAVLNIHLFLDMYFKQQRI